MALAGSRMPIANATRLPALFDMEVAQAIHHSGARSILRACRPETAGLNASSRRH
jgi:hypothetical protein